MARRAAKPSAPPEPRPAHKPDSGPAPAILAAQRPEQSEGPPLVYLAERLRRVALGLTAALITARAFWPERAQPERRGRGRALLGARASFRGRPGAGGASSERPASLSLVGDRRPGRRRRDPGGGQCDPFTRSPSGDQPRLGMGRVGLRLFAVAQPATHPQRVVGARRGARRHGGGRFGLWSFSGEGRAAIDAGGISAKSARVPAEAQHRARNSGRALAEESPVVFDRAVVDLCTRQFAGRLHRRPVRDGAGGRALQPGAAARPGVAMGRTGDGGPIDPVDARLPDADQESQRLAGGFYQPVRSCLAGAAARGAARFWSWGSRVLSLSRPWWSPA